MITNTAIPPETITAYQETEYHICDWKEHIILKISEKNTRLQKYGNCAFITPCNPLGVPVGSERNVNLMANFELMLGLHEYSYILAKGIHPVTKHREYGFLVYNISREDAISYGKWYRQNAIVFCQDCVPELILLR